MSEQASRIEHDTMGEVRVPKNALWRAQTQRAVENFPISNIRLGIYPEFVAALAAVKQAAATANKAIGVLDPAKADAIALFESRRMASVAGLSAAPPLQVKVSARYNPVGSFSRITEVATRIAGQLPSEGQSAAFKEFVWRFVNVMARALVALGRKPDYQEINRYADSEWRYAETSDETAIEEAVRGMERMAEAKRRYEEGRR